MVVAERTPKTVAALAFGSGLCALVYQVTWLRELRLVFGASTPASAAVLAVFMGGLGFGAIVLGRRAEQAASPLAFYGRLEIGIALTAGLSPLLVSAARSLYLAAGGSAALGWAGAALLRLLLAALVLGGPTFLMGGTLPALGRAVTPAGDSGRRHLGWIYGCNTFGAVAGAALTTFVLLEALGQRSSLWVAALLNVWVGLSAVRLARRGAVAGKEGPEAVEDGDGEVVAVGSPRPAAAPEATPVPVRPVLAAAGLVGFVFFLMEMVWYRLLAPLLGGTTYTLGTILLLALAGIGGGGLLYGSRSRHRVPTPAAFAATCALEALALIVPLVLSHRLALLAATLRPLAALGFHGLVLGWLVVGGIVVLPAALVAGYQFPLLVALLGEGRRQIAAQTGRALGANTAGAIAGALAGGFGLLPWIGAAGAWRLSTVLLAGLSLAAGWIAMRRGTPGARLALAFTAALAAAGLCLLPGPGALWRHGEIGVGRSGLDARAPNELRARLAFEESALMWEEDGRESTVALRTLSALAFSINGKTDGNSRADASTQVMAPLVGAALHPAPRRGLVIGLGTGSSAGWLAAVPGMERVDVVELEPAVLRVAADCAAVNRNVLEDPRVHVHLADGRELLLTADARWDVVFSEPSNPFRAGIASLFTTEFYRAVADRLAPGGLFLQWLQAYEVDAQTVGSVYTSLVGVFPHVETWSTNGSDLLLVASATPVRHDLGQLSRRLAGEPYWRALADAWGVVGVEGLYTGFVADAAFARRLAASGLPPNTDDKPVVEFGFARDLGSGSFSIAALERAVPPAERRPRGLAGVDWRRVGALRASRELMTGGGPAPGTSPHAQARWLADRVRRSGARAANAQSLVALLLAGEELAERAKGGAGGIARALLRERPVEAHVLRARWHLRSGRREQAVAELADALVGYRRDPWPWPPLMERALVLAIEAGTEPAAARRLLAALSEPFAVRLLEGKRQLARLALAERTGDDACVAIFRELEPHPPWTENVLRKRAVCYRRAGDPLAARAGRDLQRFLDDRPLTISEQLASTAARGSR